MKRPGSGHGRSLPATAAFLALALALAATGSPASQTLSEVDALMAKVLERRDVDWEALDRYVFRETERFALVGPGGIPLEREEAEYVRYVKDGILVRSPVRVNGAEVGDDERRRYEEKWLGDELRRREREKSAGEEGKSSAASGGSGTASGNGPSRRRGRRYFLGLDYEPGSYLLAGREVFEGRDVLRIEHYPSRLGDLDDDGGDGEKADRDEEEMERKLGKTTMITMLVVPGQHQIARITFDNDRLDFLPMRWLVRVGRLQASMTLDQPLGCLWLPREITAHGSATTAAGAVKLEYERRFFDYREAGVESEIRYLPPEEEAEGR